MPGVDAFFGLTALMVVGVFGLVIGVAVHQWRQTQRRRQELALWALSQGLTFSFDDPAGLDKVDLHLFSKGDGRGFENVASGTWQGLDVRVADYWYYERSSSQNGRSSRTYYRFSIVVTPVAAWLPAVRIGMESVASRLADHVGMRDLTFESEEFNRRFDIHAADREFAYKLIDARMMGWLLGTAGGHCYEVGGPWVLGYAKRLPVPETPTLLYAVKGFVAQIPRLVWADYGKATS